MKPLQLPVLFQIALVHMLSHMHVMTVPSLLPLLPASISVDFVELGLAVSLFNISSALMMEIPMGFASDRFGARLML
ncbi:MAG: hypothetical protein LBO64_02865 [Desulfovibrio sp.]|jgi:MFS family permease|nr:hypothetical protein [Desulfovibrio sp.]